MICAEDKDPASVHILVAEDNPINSRLVEKILVTEGYNVTMVENGKEIINECEKALPDLVLMDIMMPVMDGITACAALNNETATCGIPVILLTAKSDTKSISEGFQSGAVDYITKPFNAIELLHRIAVHLRLKNQQDCLREMTKRDSLTHLHNHASVYERLEEEISRANRYGTPLSLIMIDIDHFKNINDTHGHIKGDEVLVQISRIVREHTRMEDIVGRYGGEEFIIILPETGLDEARQTADKICHLISETDFDVGGIKTTISGGVETLVNEEDSAPNFVARADKLLYQAKEAGRNQIKSPG